MLFKIFLCFFTFLSFLNTSLAQPLKNSLPGKAEVTFLEKRKKIENIKPSLKKESRKYSDFFPDNAIGSTCSSNKKIVVRREIYSSALKAAIANTLF